jgi:aspartate/methionine/tyrosine aminotransferase
MINPILDTIIPYPTKNIAMSVDGKPDIINLSFGEPDYGPPEYLVSELPNALKPSNVCGHLKKYEISRGSESLRRAIAGYYLRNYKLVYDYQAQILVTHGGAGALTTALMTCTQPGDEILTPNPSYTLYERLISILGRTPKHFGRHIDQGFAYDIDSLVKSITANTRAIIINSPENPTGYICSMGELRKVIDICQDAGIWLIHDEIYDQLAFSQQHIPAAMIADSIDNVILVNSLSKKFGVPGLRIGWIAGNEKFISAAAKSQDYLSLALNKTLEQIAEILLTSAESPQWFANVRALLSQRVHKLYKALQDTSVFEFPCVPSGGMFLFPRVSKLAHLISGNNTRQNDGDVVSTWLLDQIKIATVPGGVYGTESKDFVRIVCCVESHLLDAATTRILGAVGQLVDRK